MEAAAGSSKPRRARVRDPEASRRALLEAARDEFALKGFAGARVDEIASRAGVNKQLVYHHFTDKDTLYLAVLERLYEDIRAAENELHLFGLQPERAIRKLIGFSFDYLAENPHFVALLNEENRYGAGHTRRSEKLPEMHSRFVTLLKDTLAAGVRAGIFRAGIDAMQLYISIAGMSYFYFSNGPTLSVIFDRDLGTPAAREKRRKHVIDLIMHSLRP